MALDDTFNITRPGQGGTSGDVRALHIEEYTGVVEGTIDRLSKLTGFVPVRSVRGTSVFTNNAVGQSTLQAIVPGTTPDSTQTRFARRQLTVDTTILARNSFPLLETWQTQYDARAEVGTEHGKIHAKFRDQAFFIQAIKAALLTDTAYNAPNTGVSGAGHFGGSQQVLAVAGDALDPSKMYSAISDLLVKMMLKDVNPAEDEVILAVRPDVFGALAQSELIINSDYVTAIGTEIKASAQFGMLKALGCPIIASNNLPNTVVTGHFLSNANNSNAYDGDFTKVVLAAFSPRALMAGETLPLTTNVYWSQEKLLWLVDAYSAFAVGPNRAEFAGVILKP